MKLTILIVNYNTEIYIEKLLNSLMSQTLPRDSFEIIIINNIQNDKLGNAISNKGFDHIFNLGFYQSQSNLGFGRAMNLGFQYAKGEHILLLNPDVLMRQDDYLEKLLVTANQNRNYGAISTKVLDDDDNDTSTYYSYEFGQTLGFDGQICWFQGSLLLVRHDIFVQLDGFDPDFFMYCEDVDLCLRIKRLGLELIKNDELEVYHFGGASEPNQNYDYYERYYKSRFLFAHKHYPAQVFNELIDLWHIKSKKRLTYYRITAKFIKKHQRHLVKNQVMYDITHQILTKSVDFLYL